MAFRNLFIPCPHPTNFILDSVSENVDVGGLQIRSSIKHGVTLNGANSRLLESCIRDSEPSKRIVSVIVKVCAVKKIQQCTHITLERCKNNPKSTFHTRGEGDEGICETQGLHFAN